MYIARNLDGSLVLFGGYKPKRSKRTGKWIETKGYDNKKTKFTIIDDPYDYFINLKWEDEPMMLHFERSDKTIISVMDDVRYFVDHFFKGSKKKYIRKDDLEEIINAYAYLSSEHDDIWKTPNSGITEHHLYNGSVLCKTPYEVIGVRLYLKELGYDIYATGMWDVLNNPMWNPNIKLYGNHAVANASNPDWDEKSNKGDNTFINCGTNIEMFKAIAAMRDDEVTWWKRTNEVPIKEIGLKRDFSPSEDISPCTIDDILSFYDKDGERGKYLN